MDGQQHATCEIAWVVRLNVPDTQTDRQTDTQTDKSDLIGPSGFQPGTNNIITITDYRISTTY